MKLSIGPISDIGTPDEASMVSVTLYDGEHPGQFALLLRLPAETELGQLRVLSEQDGNRTELIPKVSASAHKDMLVRALSAALNIPGEAAEALMPDERRIIGALMLNADSLVSSEDLAYAMTGAFDGVSEAQVAANVARIRTRLAEAQTHLVIAGDPESGYALRAE